MRVLLFFIIQAVLHPIHITVTNIEIKNKSKEIIIVTKFFSDDFQKIINNNYNVNLNINDSLSIYKHKKQISNYIAKNLKIIINNKSITNNKLVFYKTKSNNQATWFYFKIKKRITPKSIVIIDNLLNDLFDDQKNLVFVNYNNKHKSFKLSKNDKMCSFNF